MAQRQLRVQSLELNVKIARDKAERSLNLNLVTYRLYGPHQFSQHKADMMRLARLALALLVLSGAPAMAQEAIPAPAGKVSAWRAALTEVAIARYRIALKLTAEQEKYWPAVASALRHLARLPEINEAAVRRVAPSVSPLLAHLDDRQKQVAMNLVANSGLSQYASLF
jgi:hypothetical protein